jgi:integrase
LRRIADFLIFLFDEKKLAVSTIKGYRSMISHTLSFRGLISIGTDSSLSDLIRALELKRPVSRSLAPKWDLSCVLWSLCKAPYEPLDQASLQVLTWKTVFLLVLASAKRRSEIHALSVEDGHLRFNDLDGSVSLLCQAGFLAKTQLPSVASVPFTIPSLSQSCGRDDEDRLLCPVRSLKFYLSKVAALRGSRKRLFLPIKGKGNISAASISRWIASVIRKAYSDLTERDLSRLKIRPHELRALSTSWAFVNHTPLDEILRAAYWKNSSTFSSFYLRSLSLQKDNLFMLGPLVVAQTIVDSSSSSSLSVATSCCPPSSVK